MPKLFISLVFFFLARLSAAQFAAYPICVQPLLYRFFPASCLSLTLAAQNTCLCQDANASASSLVTGIYQQCGCADLQQTVQLTEAACSQVGIDVGPAFSVFTQDNTSCGGGGGGGSTGSSASAGTGSGTSTNAGGSTSTGTPSGTSTGIGGSTSTGTANGASSGTGGHTSTGTGGTKNSGVNNRIIIEKIIEIVIGVTGGILAL